MIELQPDDERRTEKKVTSETPENMRQPAIEDLRFFVKGSLSLFAKFVNDLDWFLTKINPRNKT